MALTPCIAQRSGERYDELKLRNTGISLRKQHQRVLAQVLVLVALPLITLHLNEPGEDLGEHAVEFWIDIIRPIENSFTTEKQSPIPRQDQLNKTAKVVHGIVGVELDERTDASTGFILFLSRST